MANTREDQGAVPMGCGLDGQPFTKVDGGGLQITSHTPTRSSSRNRLQEEPILELESVNPQ